MSLHNPGNSSQVSLNRISLLDGSCWSCLVTELDSADRTCTTLVERARHLNRLCFWHRRTLPS